MSKTLDDMIDESVDGVTDGWTADASDALQAFTKLERQRKNGEIDRQVYEILQVTGRDECSFWVTVDRLRIVPRVEKGKPTPDDPPGHPVEALDITAEAYDRFLEEYEGE